MAPCKHGHGANRRHEGARESAQHPIGCPVIRQYRGPVESVNREKWMRGMEGAGQAASGHCRAALGKRRPRTITPAPACCLLAPCRHDGHPDLQCPLSLPHGPAVPNHSVKQPQASVSDPGAAFLPRFPLHPAPTPHRLSGCPSSDSQPPLAQPTPSTGTGLLDPSMGALLFFLWSMTVSE